MKATENPWTVGRIEELRQFWKLYSVKEIAYMTGRTENSVSSKARALKLGPPRKATVFIREAPNNIGDVLRREIEAAKHEAASAPLYRGGW